MEHPLELFRYCPRCGSPRFVEHNQKSKECHNCGFVYYFNPSAATVAFILRQTQPLNEGEKTTQWELFVVHRAKEPARGTLDLPGGFSDMFETSEEGICREVKEETGMEVKEVKFLFSLPNQYLYSGFLVHTIDMFYLCQVSDTSVCQAMDDAYGAQWIRLQDLCPADFGLTSIRLGVEKFLANFPI